MSNDQSLISNNECWHICPTCPVGRRDWCHILVGAAVNNHSLDKWIQKCPKCRAKEHRNVSAMHQAVEGTVS